MEFKEKRSAHRHPVQLPIKYRVAVTTNGARTEFVTPIRRSVTKDVSPEGLLFFSEEKFEPNTILQLTIPTQNKQFKLQARVAHVALDQISRRFKTGVQFLNPESVFKVKMAEQLLQILEYQKKLSGVEGRSVTEDEAAKRWIHDHSEHFAEFYQS